MLAVNCRIGQNGMPVSPIQTMQQCECTIMLPIKPTFKLKQTYDLA
jgi:hypothetical protein